MSFTRKHYEETARIIATRRLYAETREEHGVDANYLRGYLTATGAMQENLSRMFAADNPRFDAERFAKACEPGSGK